MIVAENIEELAVICDWLADKEGREPVLIYLEQSREYLLLERRPLGDVLTLREQMQEMMWAFGG